MKAEHAQIVFWVVGAIAQIAVIVFAALGDYSNTAIFQALVVFSIFGANYAGTKKAPPKTVSLDDLSEVVKREFKANFQHPHYANQTETAKYPGLSVNFAIRFHRVEKKSRQHVFEIGEGISARLSLYFDPRNTLAFAITYANGETDTIRVQTIPVGIPFDKFMYITCEFGIKPDSTFLRISLNAHDIGTVNIPIPFEGLLTPSGFTIGANTNGQDGAYFDLVQYVICMETLTTEEKLQLVNYTAQKEPEQCLVFNGSSWMQQNKDGDLEQQNDKHKPLLLRL